MSSSTTHNHIDIVCFSLARWNAEISSPAVSLARELAKNHRVFFIGHPYSWKDVLSGRKEKSNRTTEPVPPNVTLVDAPRVLPVNFLPDGKIYRSLFGYNQRLLLHTLRRTLAAHQVRQYIFINFFDPFFLGDIPADIAPLKYVYQCMDDMSQVEYTKRHGVSLENEIIRHADLVLCTSRELTRLKSRFSTRVHFHPNAADFALFHTAARHQWPRPPEMDFPGKKIIGFMGSVEYRTDFLLLKKIAERHPEKIIFLLGPVAGNEHVDAGLNKLPNVVFAGARPLTGLPAFVQYFDCCIIPYRINTLTASIYPLKINEYLAAGKPVVSTAFSEDILSFRDVAYLVSTHDEFLHAIDTALVEDNEVKKAARVAKAAENTWTKRVEQFWQLVT